MRIRTLLNGGGNLHNGYEYVDLGLSVNWASYNVGASKETEPGLYFKWGATAGYPTPTSDFQRSTYLTGVNELPLVNDAANIIMGGAWRTPSASEVTELLNACNRTFVNNYKGSKYSGLLLTLKKDSSKTIFLPNAGRLNGSSADNINGGGLGYYWCNNPSSSSAAYSLQVTTAGNPTIPQSSKAYGLSVRGVFNEDDIYVPVYNNGYEYLDLGLSVKWATCNVGATRPEGYGLYFACGEITGYSGITTEKKFSWDDYKFGGSSSNFTKYNSTDGLRTLQPEDDAARVNMGSSWRMPTFDEILELYNACDTMWTTINGVYGRLFVLKTKKSKQLFFPATGYCINGVLQERNSIGRFWGSTINSEQVSRAYYLMVNSTDAYPYGHLDRCYGMTVRGVFY
ncbi:MAG: hypothetical protein J1F67_05195 [Muribaculaceae bacterium]|nr:hypothetical protein [Muribaculaceae bacterium]